MPRQDTEQDVLNRMVVALFDWYGLSAADQAFARRMVNWLDPYTPEQIRRIRRLYDRTIGTVRGSPRRGGACWGHGASDE
jgi:hypothetical protein